MQNKRFDYIGKLKWMLCISLAIMLVGVIFNVINGTKLDINFSGGTTATYSYEGEIDYAKVEKTASEIFGVAVKTSESTDYTSGAKNVVITVVGNKSISGKQQTTLKEELNKIYPDNNFEEINFNSVEKTVGADFLAKALYSMIIASVLVAIYVGIRFRNIGGISATVMAVFALVHDIILAYFTYIILGMPLDDNFIAVVLTILGFSLNDTIVIYSRIRENTVRYREEMDMKDIVNLSISQSFTRTLVTSIAAIVATTTITVVAILMGMTSILTFTIPMTIGLTAGWYSSTMLSGPLWYKWIAFKEKHFKKKASNKKAYNAPKKKKKK